MKRDDGFITFLQELLEPLGQISMRRMFGGHGVYCNGLFIAIVVDGRPYFKVDAQSRETFVAAGCAPFVYTGKDHPVEMSYWNLPEEALDSPQTMQPWARLAIAAAMRKPAAKTVRKPARKRTK